MNHKFLAIGYHGTDLDIKTKNDINFDHNQYKDHFLGRGLYLFRDSYKRAKGWTDNQHKGNSTVLEVKLESDELEILNFTSSKWNYEMDILELFVELCKEHKIHFGTFLDFLIEQYELDIKAIAIIDLKTKNHFIPIRSEYKTLFAYGDIQICVKSQDIISELKVIV